MKRIFTNLFVAVLLMLSTTSWAQFTNGKVYRIVCSGSPSVSLGASALSDVAALSTSETDRAQQWYVTGSNGKYTFRNLANGRYLLGHKDYSNEWRLTEESNEFTVDQVNGNYAIYQTSHGTYYTYMHKDGSNNIVSWESSAANSQWTPYEVSYTAAELQAIWNEVESFILTEDAVKGYEEKLMAIFTDKACTQLNSTYASKSVSQIEADANYQALPAVLQAMVLKVKNNDWSEANAVSSKPQWGSDYAKKFRVQMYEPYSIEGEITSYLRINAHCNMDNPTGLYANSGKAMYIMVEGEIKEGAELWVAYQTGLGATNYYNNASYTQLREGLNVVPYFYDTSSLWINYVVHTYNANGATNAEKFPHKLSDYKPLKIHIEGGYINGYYNAIGDFRAADSGTENLWGDVDNDDDWNYYMERAPLDGNDGRPNRDFPLLAHRQTLLFPLAPVVDDGGVTRAGLYHRIANIEVPSVPNCYGGSGNTFGTFDGSYPGMGLSTSNGKINIMLEAWDRIMYSQLASMGVVSKSTMDKMNALYPRWTSAGTTAEIYDYNNKSSLDNKTYLEFCNGIDYSEYFNHHGCGVGWPNGYMSGGWRVTAYHYETMEGIIGTMASSSGSTWGPAHEIGHQHQSIINLEGQTEVTNNLFSNIAVWYMGMATSRYDGSQGSLESVLGAFTTEGSDLYANNIWALTHLYYRLWLYYHLAGNNTQFWPRLFELCRQVPLENHPNGTNDGSTTLLRFYQHACDAAGEDLTEFFRAHGYFEVMDNRVVGDYYGATYNQTQAQIDAAIASVKAKNYPANYAVLLINDGTSETTFKHNGATRRGLWDGYATAEFGSVNDFISGDADVTTNYEASLDSDGSITMSGGEGGIGFLMFNEKGELVAFSNKSTFKLGKEAKELYQNGQARIVVVNADNEIIGLGEEIVPEPEDPAISAKKAELQALIDATRGLVATVADVSAAVDAAVDLRGKLYAERPYTAGGTNHSDYSSVENNYNLLDNRVDTHFHSDYNYSTMVSPPYIRVDLGEGESAAKFKFNYTTRNASGCAPTKINVYAGNEQTLNGTTIATFTINDSENPLPTATSTSWTSRDIECGTACRYFKFEVVESQGAKTENGVKKYYFVMSEFGFNKVSDAVITIKDEYKDSKVTEELLVATNNAVVDAQKVKDKTSSSIALLEAQIAALQAAKTALEKAMQETDNSASASKAELLELMGVVQGLYQEIADETNGVVEDYYTTVLTQADIDELITVMQYAGTVHESSTATADEITVAYNELNAVYERLKAVQKADYTDRDALTALVADATTLVNDVVTVNKTATAIALQATDANAPYYIHCNAPGATNNYEGDDLGVAALLDVDDNGEPITATFLHTSYVDGSHDDALDHYLRVDMGESNLLSFKFRYTPRIGNTNNAPLVMLIEGSNNCVNFEEITTLSDMATTYQSDEITNGKAYRYIRFMVKDTHNHSAHNGHPFFAMSHFEMTACKTITISDEYASQNLSVGVVANAYNELVDAGTVISHYATNDAVTVAENELRAAYDALVATITTMDKELLKELIDATTLLKNSLYEITSYTATDVALQNTDEAAAGYLYCNAPETNSPWASDNIGVGAAIDLTAGGDPDLSTFLHTEYGNDPSADGLDHYLRVDLGAEGATAYIEFGYVGRSGHEPKSPETAIVEATNDLNGEWTTIKTLNLAQPGATAETKTGALGNGVAYRYWRFMVTDTHFDGYDGQGNHKFFALSDFNVYKCTDIVFQLNDEYNPDIYIYTTTGLVAEVEGVINAATEVYDNAAATAEDCNGAITALQAEYDKLAEAIRYHDAPVRITTDENNPVLYKIISKRDNNGGKVLQFDEPESNNVTIVDAEANASYQAWYFVKGKDGYIIKPFNGQGNMLGVEDTSDGRDKALITAGPAHVEWTFARSAVAGCTDYYYIYVNGTNHACLSHNGGFNLTTKLGIWADGWNTDDGGSLFKFVDAEFENDNAHYYQLCDFAGALETMTAATPQGTVVGAYEYGDAYDEALDAATTLREAGNTSDAAACRDAYTALRAAYKDIKQILPVEGKYYRIDLTPGMSEDDARRGASMRIDDNAKLECGEYDASNARFYFTFEYDDNGNLYMKNLHTGTYLDEANAHNSDVQVGADAEAITDAKLITIKTLGTTSGGAVVVGIVPTGGAMLNCTAKPGAVKAWDNADVNKASAWVISEVEDLSQIAHTVTMSATFSSVMLGYNATVPAGVEAYNAEGVEDGYVSLVEVARVGGVIPANTPVILYRTDDTKEKIFTYTENDATNIPYETVLGGSLYQKFVECDGDKRYYKLMIKSGEAKMYWMYKEFDAAGNKVGENNGGHIKCSANKIYMALPSQQQAASYGMRFVEPGTTGVDEVKTENGEVKTIYDLQGRKLTEIAEPGFYIVNGKKVYVK